jgi:hypothetical protein
MIKKSGRKMSGQDDKKDFTRLTFVLDELFTIQDKQILEEVRQMP